MYSPYEQVHGLITGLLMSVGDMEYQSAAVAATELLAGTSLNQTADPVGPQVAPCPNPAPPRFGADPDTVPYTVPHTVSGADSEPEIPDELQPHPEEVLLNEDLGQLIEQLITAGEGFFTQDPVELFDSAMVISDSGAMIGTRAVCLVRHEAFDYRGEKDERFHRVQCGFLLDLTTQTLVRFEEKHTPLAEPPK